MKVDLFPLKTAREVVTAVLSELDADHGRTPNFAALSILLGLVEAQLTSPANLKIRPDDSSLYELVSSDAQSIAQLRSKDDFILPHAITYSRVKVLLEQFKTLVKGSADLSTWTGLDTKEKVARAADLIWSYLSPNYGKISDEKGDCVSGDSAHVQFLTSFLLERRLDPFGLTFATLAAFQVLFPKACSDLLITLSEDHSWISIHQNNSLTRVEVTWHGKTDKRDSVVNPLADNWLYLKGHTVVCDTPELTLAALVSSMNPYMSPSADSLPLANVQRLLLSELHARGALNRYPMALGALADLAELSGSVNVESVIRLYYEAITSAITHYENHHIYPYLYLAGFWFRSRVYSHALFCWRNAAQVVSRYNYNPKEDEEAYKEFQEIASDLIPYALNQLATGDPGLAPEHYRDLIEFYDGLCGWEQSSRWPVLHITWSKSFVSCLNKFPHKVRAQVVIRVIETDATGEEKESQAPLKEQSEFKKVPRSKEEIMKLVENCSKDATFLLSPTNADEELADRSASPDSVDATALANATGPTEIKVCSQKMSSVKDLLTKSEGKLNSSAIQLQITAQSSLFTTSKACTRVASPQQVSGKRLRCH